MKLVLFTFFTLIIWQSSAQQFTRGKKNIGFSFGASHIKTHNSKSFYKGNNGLALHAGLSRQFGNILFPSIHYRWMGPSILYEDQPRKESVHAVSLPILVKYPILGFYTGKSRRYECKGLGFSAVLGMQYDFNLGKSDFGTFNNTFYLVGGFELLPSRRSGSKSVQGWSFHYDILYKFAANRYLMSVPSNWFTNQICLQATFYKHKTYKFSNM